MELLEIRIITERSIYLACRSVGLLFGNKFYGTYENVLSRMSRSDESKKSRT